MMTGRRCRPLKLTILVCLALTAYSCSEPGVEDNTFLAASAAPLVLKVIGAEQDTAYLNTNYMDPGAELQNTGRCMYVSSTGTVNTSMPGDYVIDYDYEDPETRQTASVSRTVHVVRSAASFMFGDYKVACACTITSGQSKKVTVTADTYTAKVTPYMADRKFEVWTMKIGSAYVIPTAFLDDNILLVDFYNRNFDEAVTTGTVAASKNSFTLETTASVGHPADTFSCINVYTKKLQEVPVVR